MITGLTHNEFINKWRNLIKVLRHKISEEQYI